MEVHPLDNCVIMPGFQVLANLVNSNDEAIEIPPETQLAKVVVKDKDQEGILFSPLPKQQYYTVSDLCSLLHCSDVKAASSSQLVMNKNVVVKFSFEW